MRTARSMAAMAAGALTLAGCAAQAQSPPDPAAPTVSRAPAATQTPSAGAAGEAEVPERPRLDPPVRPTAMERDDVVGAEAAAEYFIGLYPYVYATGDLTEWRRMSHPECVFCSSVVENVENLHGMGGYRVGGSLLIDEVTGHELVEGYEYQRVEISVVEGKSKVVRPGGEEAVRTAAGGPKRLIAAVETGRDGWVVREMQIEDDGDDDR